MNKARRAAALLGGELAEARPLAGGDLSQVLHIRLADGREAVVKGGPDCRAEAAMLRAILDAGAPAPEVLAVDGDMLVLEMLVDDGRLGAAMADLGRVLKRLHASEGARYGWDGDYAFGPVAIENAYLDDWAEFWAHRRLIVHLPHLPETLARRVEALCLRLRDMLPARPRTSLLHGDLWGGNVLSDGGKVCGLIDPACYYGDGEVDIAMLNLFGNTDDAFQSAYGCLAPGWRERRPIYTLWPALVHLRLFGAGYRPLVERLLTECGF